MKKILSIILAVMLVATLCYAAPPYFAVDTTTIPIGDLSDVTIGTAITNDTLQYNGSVWENRADIIVNTLTTDMGTATAPGVRITDAGGFFQSGSDVLGIETGGVERLKISGSAVAGIGTGAYNLRHGTPSVSLPVYSHNGDSDSGRWRSAANTLEWVTGGVEVFNITNTTEDSSDTLITIEGGMGPYGELWWHEIDGVGTGTDIEIATTTAFSNLASADMSTGLSSNTTLSAANGSITVSKGGLYKINGSYSFTTSTGAAEVHHMIGVNGSVQLNCNGHRSITLGGGTDIGNVGLTCLFDLDANDVVTTLVNSVANETVQYEAFNLNVSK
jgi:hypothetical protein